MIFILEIGPSNLIVHTKTLTVEVMHQSGMSHVIVKQRHACTGVVFLQMNWIGVDSMCSFAESFHGCGAFTRP